MKTKEKRFKAIKELVESRAIEDQDQLTDLLSKEYGITANQSIISRDLRTLGIAKHVRDGKSIYELQTLDVNKEILFYAVVDVTHNETLIVVHTLAGLASFVGDYLDNQESDSLIGTVAGENIVMVIPQSIKKINQIYKEVCSLLSFKLKD